MTEQAEEDQRAVFDRILRSILNAVNKEDVQVEHCSCSWSQDIQVTGTENGFRCHAPSGHQHIRLSIDLLDLAAEHSMIEQLKAAKWT